MNSSNSKPFPGAEYNTFPNPIPDSPLRESPLSKYPPHKWIGGIAGNDETGAIMRARAGGPTNDSVYSPFYKNRFSYPPVVDLPNASVPVDGTVLYHTKLSPFAMKVRMALNEKKVQYKSHIVDFAKFEHLSPEYCSINPRGTIPTLAVDGRVTTDDREILYYIDETFPGIDLVPKGDDEKASMEYFIDVVTRQNVSALAFGPIPGVKKLTLPSRFTPQLKKLNELKEIHQNNRSLMEMYRHKEEVMEYTNDICNDPNKMRQVFGNVELALGEIEHQLTNGPFGPGGWLVSDQFTLADIHTLCFLRMLDILELIKFAGPQTHRYYMQGKTRQSFKECDDDWFLLALLKFHVHLPTVWHKIGFFSLLFLILAALFGAIGYSIYALVKLLTRSTPVEIVAPKYTGLRGDVVNVVGSPAIHVGSTDPWMKWMVFALPAMLLIPFFLWIFGCVKCTKRSGRNKRAPKKARTLPSSEEVVAAVVARGSSRSNSVSSIEEGVVVTHEHTEVIMKDGSDVVVITEEHKEVVRAGNSRSSSHSH